MSKMFEYISGKSEGRVAEREAQLEHVMAHCIPASALDEERDRCIEIVRSALDGHGEYIRSVGEKIAKRIRQG